MKVNNNKQTIITGIIMLIALIVLLFVGCNTVEPEPQIIYEQQEKQVDSEPQHIPCPPKVCLSYD